ncbi:MAG: sugar phosphate isomerase/epimerase [Anaeroplasmataceae bacterium]|nr:sugar phosphate isomerase/epimerase [Anaeroplasmataceae bacterium]
MSNLLGIMQGRFSNKGGFFPQNFPWENWQSEFEISKKSGIDCIEWMFNAEKFQENPIWTETGKREIKSVMSDTGVIVNSICANYFMQHSVWDKKNAFDILEYLIKAAAELNIRQIIIPFFGESEAADIDAASSLFASIDRELSGLDIHIGFESDEPIMIQKLICQRANTDKVGICYDVGNAAGNGYDSVKDIFEIWEYLLEIHLKDKPYKGSSVMLGKGAVPFEDLFQRMKTKNMIYILESYFGEDAVNDTRKNIQFIREKLYD